MSDKKPEGAKPEGDAAKAPAAKEEATKGGGLQAWLPLIVSIVLMPALAFATTKFLILPKVVAAREAGGHGEDQEDGGHETKSEAHDAKAGGEKEGAKPKDSKESKEGHGKEAAGKGKKKQNVQISKVIVNVSGSMGTRYLMTSFTLVGTHTDFKNLIEENKDQLLDLANTAMASKTISDLEKPGSRNQIRAELISIFNNALGGNLVQEIYFTEFAVQ
jgi:flagellar FliL protein